MFQRITRLGLAQVSKRHASSAANAPRVFGIRDRLLQHEIEKELNTDELLNKIQRKEPIRVTVTGAAGAIGYALVFRLANGELLGPNQPIHLNCLELPNAVDKLKGVAMELEDCAFPLLQSITVTDDPAQVLCFFYFFIFSCFIFFYLFFSKTEEKKYAISHVTYRL